MAFKIPDTAQKRLSDGAQELQELRNKLEDGLWTYNEAVKAARDRLQRLAQPYEAKARQLHDLIENIKNAAEDEFEDMSDEWKDSDAGEAADEWIESLDEAMTSLDDPLNMPEVEELDVEVVIPEDLTEIINSLDAEPNEE